MRNKVLPKDNPFDSVRWRLMLTLLLTFALNAFILTGYFRFVLSDSIQMITQRYNESRTTMRDTLDEITDRAEQEADWEGYLLRVAREENIGLEVVDQKRQTVLVVPLPERTFTLGTSVLMTIGDGTYLVRGQFPFSSEVVNGMQPSTMLFFVELFTLMFCMLICGRVIYKQHIQPIEEMRNIVDSYRRGIKPPVSMRKDEIGKLQNSFVELTDSIENERFKQKQIIASISHDIKTPLTSIMGYAERLQRGNISPERTERYIQTIYDKSRAIAELIEEFDEYLSYDSKGELKQELMDTAALAALIRQDFEAELSELDVRLEVECSCDGRMLLDVAKIRRVFGNIIGNSLKHFDTADKRIRVIMTRSYGYVRISIEDNGSGVPSERLPHIFDPFYTSDAGRRVAGLGLSICQEIVEAHGGHIWAENLNKGLRINMEFKVI